MARTKKVKDVPENAERIEELKDMIEQGTKALNSAREALAEAKEEYQAIAGKLDELSTELQSLQPIRKDTAITDFLAARRKAFAEKHDASLKKPEPKKEEE